MRLIQQPEQPRHFRHGFQRMSRNVLSSVLFALALAGFSCGVWGAEQTDRGGYYQPTYENPEGHKRKSFWERTTEDPIAFYTLWLAAFTLVLCVSTLGLWVVTWRGAKRQSRDMRESIDATAKSAAAAQKSADVAERAVIDLEGPFLYPVVISDTFEESFRRFVLYDHQASNMSSAQPKISFKFKNYGRTHALPESVGGVLFYGEPKELMPDREAGLFPDLLIAAGETSSAEISRTMTQGITAEIYRSIANGGMRIHLQGSIVYYDLFGTRFQQTYCWYWSPKSKSFLAWGPSRNQRKRIGAALAWAKGPADKS